jgi:hypothetical protein
MLHEYLFICRLPNSNSRFYEFIHVLRMYILKAKPSRIYYHEKEGTPTMLTSSTFLSSFVVTVPSTIPMGVSSRTTVCSGIDGGQEYCTKHITVSSGLTHERFSKPIHFLSEIFHTLCHCIPFDLRKSIYDDASRLASRMRIYRANNVFEPHIKLQYTNSPMVLKSIFSPRDYQSNIVFLCG